MTATKTTTTSTTMRTPPTTSAMPKEQSTVPVLVVDPTQTMEGDIVKMSMEPKTKGQNVSGRSWKIRPQKRGTSLKRNILTHQSKTWEQRQAGKIARQEALQLQNELREERRQEKILKRERRLEQEKRRMDNEFQQASKSAKQLNLDKLKTTLKSMSKKQLRQVKKTRINPKTGVAEFVPAYSK